VGGNGVWNDKMPPRQIKAVTSRPSLRWALGRWAGRSGTVRPGTQAAARDLHPLWPGREESRFRRRGQKASPLLTA